MLETVPGSECLVGFRAWNLYHPHYLVSGNLVYEPRKRHEAKCFVDHLAPDEKCTCGMYAFKTVEDLKKQGYAGRKVLGEVWMWGKIVEHAGGYRAQYSYPKKFCIARDNLSSFPDKKTVSPLDIDSAALAPYLSFVYGVPFEILEPGHVWLPNSEPVKPRVPRPRPAPGQSDPGTRKDTYYQVTAQKQIGLPPQARALLRILQDLMKTNDPVPEKLFVEALMRPGALTTVQHPWHIFAYYKSRLIREGYLVASKRKNWP